MPPKKNGDTLSNSQLIHLSQFLLADAECAPQATARDTALRAVKVLTSRQMWSLLPARQAAWNPAGFEPVHWKLANINHGSLKWVQMKNELKFGANGTKSNKRVYTKSKRHFQDASLAMSVHNCTLVTVFMHKCVCVSVRERDQFNSTPEPRTMKGSA